MITIKLFIRLVYRWSYWVFVLILLLMATIHNFMEMHIQRKWPLCSQTNLQVIIWSFCAHPSAKGNHLGLPMEMHIQRQPPLCPADYSTGRHWCHSTKSVKWQNYRAKVQPRRDRANQLKKQQLEKIYTRPDQEKVGPKTGKPVIGCWTVCETFVQQREDHALHTPQ